MKRLAMQICLATPSLNQGYACDRSGNDLPIDPEVVYLGACIRSKLVCLHEGSTCCVVGKCHNVGPCHYIYVIPDITHESRLWRSLEHWYACIFSPVII